MSGWNSHSYLVQGTPLLQYSTGDVLGQYRPGRMETEVSDMEAFDLPAPQLDEYASREEGSQFCTKNNLLNSIAYVNQELELLGLACLTFDGTRCTSDVVFFINRLHDLLRLYHKTAAVKEDLETRNHRLICETEHQQAASLRLKRLQEQTDRELDQEREKTRQISLKYNQVCIGLKSEKEDVRRLTAVLQSRDIQHKHEQKKKEREIQKLKERLHQLLADKVPDRKVGMDLMNIVGRKSQEGRRATWKSGPEKEEEEMYQILVENYEGRHQELIQENGELRDCLLSLQRELASLVKRTGDFSFASVVNISSHSDLSVPSDDGEQSGQCRPTITDLDEGYFHMPYDLVRHEIERAFKETCEQISNSMRKSLIRNVAKGHTSMTLTKSAGLNCSEKDHVDKRHSSETSEVERLRKQVINYKAIIQQQEDLIRQSITSHSLENSFLHESQQGNLSPQTRISVDEKINIEKEKKAVTEAAIRLGKERQLLQEERAKLIKQHFLNISSFKHNKHNFTKSTKEDGHTSRLLPVTPNFSPAKSSSRVHVNRRSSTDLGLSQASVQISTSPSSVQPCSHISASPSTAQPSGHISSPSSGQPNSQTASSPPSVQSNTHISTSPSTAQPSGHISTSPSSAQPNRPTGTSSRSRDTTQEAPGINSRLAAQATESITLPSSCYSQNVNGHPSQS